MGKRKCNSKYCVDSIDSADDENPIIAAASGSKIRDKQPLKSTHRHFEVSDSPDNLHSLYHLLGSDSAGLSLVSKQLDGTNYGTWMIAVTMSLEAKNKIGFIDGSVVKPDEDDPYYKIWCRCNSMVKSWLLNSVTKKIYTSVLYFKTAADI
ncbi:hypothetical protein V5N11_018530 [Cardamine amara subsp. amara]|uniref:Retrotransposon Copia-like N-terminal domain-containing protein n=1 Tax=Cardamine amara subsp. amara TaxID=228776 RepID=A0ABD0ZEH2_CARAN